MTVTQPKYTKLTAGKGLPDVCCDACVRLWHWPRRWQRASSGLAVIAANEATNFSRESLGTMFREAIEPAGLPITRKGSTVKGAKATA